MHGKNTQNGRTAGAVRLAIFVLALAAALSAAAAAAERQGPRISIHEGRFDFGSVEQGAVPEHIFEIRNLGDEVLEIGRVQPT